MKRFAPAILIILSGLAAQAHAIDFWHSNTVWAGQGQCSAVFSFDSGMEEVKNLQVAVTVLNKANKRVASGVLEIPRFGQSAADRYAEAFLESDELCSDDLVIVVNKATAAIYGKRSDLLKSKALVIRDFKPFKIRIGK